MGSDLLDVVLDAWDRNNRILVNLLRAVPEDGLAARVMAGSPTVSQMFTHMHYVRLVFLYEDAPEFARSVPEREWADGLSTEQMAGELEASAQAVREAVGSMVRSGKAMKVHYDHPLLFLEHMIWHEGYHHGQIKLALKMAGHAFDDEQIGPLTWDVWMDKTH
ncbi:DinB family protein [Edaphobacter flagellatus]|uniref:DinB family protein n=1 Tax=Edaphobacter flagellatus TaxID=1933044 RepID=UPI0021B35CCD|nr:DinB family protein [Edaphobacter flagellatus]